MPSIARDDRFWFLVAAAGLIALTVGAVGPWVTALGILSVSGISNWNDGWLVLAGAGLAAAVLYDLWTSKSRRNARLIVVSGALVLFTLYERREVTKASDDLVQVGWGLNLAVAGAIALLVSAINLGTGSVAPNQDQPPVTRA